MLHWFWTVQQGETKSVLFWGVDSYGCKSPEELWPTCASSCGEPSGLNGRRHVRRGGTGRVCVQCAFWSGGSIRLIWRTSSRILPSYSGRASHLKDVNRSILTYFIWHVNKTNKQKKKQKKTKIILYFRFSPVCVLMCALRWELFV